MTPLTPSGRDRWNLVELELDGFLDVAARIVRGLDERLTHDGFRNVAEAVGTGVDDWL